MATIKEIAALAGVSRGTVDRVLNNRGAVNPETQKRVQEIAAHLNYQPNKAGLILAAQKKNYKIGVLLFSDSTLFFHEIMAGIEGKLSELPGYNLSIVQAMVPFEETAQLRAIDRLVEKEINALIIAPYNSESISKRINELVANDIPVITVNTDIDSDRMAFVGCDFYHSGITAAGLLGRMTFGEVNLGIILGSNHILCHTDRARGLQDRINEAYPHISIVANAENHDDDIESYKVVTNMLNDNPELNCIYFMAGGVSGGCKAVEDYLKEHPRKLQIFAYDNISTTVEYVKKGLITAIICQQQYNQGYQAFDILTKYLFENALPENDRIILDIDIRVSENL